MTVRANGQGRLARARSAAIRATKDLRRRRNGPSGRALLKKGGRLRKGAAQGTLPALGRLVFFPRFLLAARSSSGRGSRGRRNCGRRLVANFFGADTGRHRLELAVVLAQRGREYGARPCHRIAYPAAIAAFAAGVGRPAIVVRTGAHGAPQRRQNRRQQPHDECVSYHVMHLLKAVEKQLRPPSANPCPLPVES